MIVFDTETTHLALPQVANLNEQPWMIELGVIVLDDSTYREIDRYSALVRPGIPLDELEHQKITKLTNEQLEQAEPFPRQYETLTRLFLGQRRMYAHNCAFDVAVLSFELQRMNAEFAFPYPPEQVCTAEYCAGKYGKRRKLGEWFEAVFGKKPPKSHRAIDDAETLAKLIRKLKL